MISQMDHSSYVNDSSSSSSSIYRFQTLEAPVLHPDRFLNHSIHPLLPFSLSSPPMTQAQPPFKLPSSSMRPRLSLPRPHLFPMLNFEEESKTSGRQDGRKIGEERIEPLGSNFSQEITRDNNNTTTNRNLEVVKSNFRPSVQNARAQAQIQDQDRVPQSLNRSLSRPSSPSSSASTFKAPPVLQIASHVIPSQNPYDRKAAPKSRPKPRPKAKGVTAKVPSSRPTTAGSESSTSAHGSQSQTPASQQSLEQAQSGKPSGTFAFDGREHQRSHLSLATSSTGQKDRSSEPPGVGRSLQAAKLMDQGISSSRQHQTSARPSTADAGTRQVAPSLLSDRQGGSSFPASSASVASSVSPARSSVDVKPAIKAHYFDLASVRPARPAKLFGSASKWNVSAAKYATSVDSRGTFQVSLNRVDVRGFNFL